MASKLPTLSPRVVTPCSDWPLVPPPFPLSLYPQTPPRQTAANCIVTLQICSANQLGLTWAGGLTTGMIRILGGSPLVTWERDESRITMKAEDYAPIAASIRPLSPPPLLFFLPPLVPSVPAVSQPLKSCHCWRQKPEDGRVWREEQLPPWRGPHLPFQSGAKPLILEARWIMQFGERKFDVGLSSAFDGLLRIHSRMCLQGTGVCVCLFQPPPPHLIN